MGKASRWFKELILKLNKPNPNQKNTTKKKKKKWTSFIIKSNKENVQCYNKHCFGQRGVGYEEELAAVTIQSHFRAYLSRRALRALKALVRLQALVRGHLIRKRTGDAHRQLQALVRAQTRARVGRFLNSGSPHSTIKSSHFSYSGPETPEICDHSIRTRTPNHEQILKRNGSKSNAFGNYVPARRNLFQSYHLSLNSDQNCQAFSTSKDSTARKTGLISPSSGEVRSFGQLKIPDDDESVFCTANNSPQYYSASSRAGSSKRGVFTPTKSESSRSCLSGHLDRTPSYMAYTESSKAKVRSLSAPKQRPQYERSSSTTRNSVYGPGSTRTVALQNTAYPGSGRLDRLGTPVRGDVNGSSGRLWVRY